MLANSDNELVEILAYIGDNLGPKYNTKINKVKTKVLAVNRQVSARANLILGERLENVDEFVYAGKVTRGQHEGEREPHPRGCENVLSAKHQFGTTRMTVYEFRMECVALWK